MATSYRFKSGQRHHVGAKSALLRRFFIKTSSAMLPCSSFSAKRRTPGACSLASALTTALARYQPFSVKSAPLTLIHGADFPFYRLLLYLFRKSRLRLSGCRSSPQKATLGSAARLQAPSAHNASSRPGFSAHLFHTASTKKKGTGAT